MELSEVKKEDELILILKSIVLESPELIQLIDARAELKIREKEIPEFLTREQLAKMWQISKPTIDRMTDKELRKEGFIRKKIGVSVRFERDKSLKRYSNGNNL